MQFPMSQRARDLLLLVALSLAANGAVAWLVEQPGYLDAYYYFNGGQLIASGRGFFEPYIWNYVNAPLSLPAPAFAFWQPAPSMLAALGIWALGRWLAPFDAAQTLYVALAVCLPVMTYEIGRRVGERRHALLAGLLIVFSGFYAIYWSLPESFTPFTLAAGGTLALVGLSTHRNLWMWMLAGACAGAAHLTRTDGIMLITIVLLTILVRAPKKEYVRLLSIALGGYLLVMGVWLWRNYTVYGGILPPGGSTVIWLIEYNDLFNYPQNLTPERFAAAGWQSIVSERWAALTNNLTKSVVVQNLIVLTPFTLIGLYRQRREQWLFPALTYWAILFGLMTFVFPAPGYRGGYLHSGAALLPFICIWAAKGLDDAAAWVAQHLRWEPGGAQTLFSVGVVAAALIMTIFVIGTSVIGGLDLGNIKWNAANRVYLRIGSFLDGTPGAPQDVRVMSGNTPGFYYMTGRGGVPLPNGDEETLLRAAEDYNINYVLIDVNHPAGLASLFDDGPSTDRLRLVESFLEDGEMVYLYAIIRKP